MSHTRAICKEIKWVIVPTDLSGPLQTRLNTTTEIIPATVVPKRYNLAVERAHVEKSGSAIRPLDTIGLF